MLFGYISLPFRPSNEQKEKLRNTFKAMSGSRVQFEGERASIVPDDHETHYHFKLSSSADGKILILMATTAGVSSSARIFGITEAGQRIVFSDGARHTDPAPTETLPTLAQSG